MALRNKSPSYYEFYLCNESNIEQIYPLAVNQESE